MQQMALGDGALYFKATAITNHTNISDTHALD